MSDDALDDFGYPLTLTERLDRLRGRPFITGAIGATRQDMHEGFRNIDDEGALLYSHAQALEAHVSAPFHDWMEEAREQWETLTLPTAIAEGGIIDRGPDFLAKGYLARYVYAG